MESPCEKGGRSRVVVRVSELMYAGYRGGVSCFFLAGPMTQSL